MRKRKCPYCWTPMTVEKVDENLRVWTCEGKFRRVDDSLIRHEIWEYRCGICGKWGGRNMVVDEATTTGHAHSKCRDLEILHFRCECGEDTFIERGNSFHLIMWHKEKRHIFTIERTFKRSTVKKIVTAMGRELKAGEL